MALLEVKDLHTFFKTKRGIVKAVNGVSYTLEAGKTLGIVGESGSGKSVSAMSILRLLDGNGYIDSGEIWLEGEEITSMSIEQMQHIRGNKISVIFQEPMTSLNPVFKIEKQIGEVFEVHQGMTKKEAKAKSVEMLRAVGIPNPEKVAKNYPHQLSGGMRQRVMIAMALACKPRILIADEPTTALDVTIQAQILRLIKSLQRDFKFTIVFITHDLGVVANIADRVAVLYAGQIAELGTVEDIFYDSRHPYTWALLSSLPQLANKGDELYSISGTPPSLYNEIIGDPFAARNPYCLKIDLISSPPMFKISDTHYAKTWLLDERAPKVKKPEIINNIHEKMLKSFNL